LSGEGGDAYRSKVIRIAEEPKAMCSKKRKEKMMKFMRISQRENTYNALSAEKLAQVSAATMAFHDKHVKSGKCKDIYWLTDGTTMSIWDLSSIDELFQISSENPMRPYLLSEETVPIADYQDVVRIRQERAATAKKAARK
jgi:muconolactone delta-isomerase